MLTFASGIVTAAAILLAPVMIGLGETYVVPGPDTVADLAILGAAGVTITMYITFLIIIRAAGPVFFSQFNYVVVVAGLGWGILFFDETPQRLRLGRCGADAGGRRAADPRRKAPAGDARGALAA